jgi:DNA invertase Pin-like site-specific DNA recombinase
MFSILDELGYVPEQNGKNFKIQHKDKNINIIHTDSKDIFLKSNEYEKINNIFYSKEDSSPDREELVRNAIITEDFGTNIDDEKKYCNFKRIISQTKTTGTCYFRTRHIKVPYGNAIGYNRVSTTMQADDGKSLDNQESKIYDYANKYGLTLRMIVTDEGKSASSSIDCDGLSTERRLEKMLSKRKGLKEIIEKCENGDTIVFHSVSRFMRNMLLFLHVINILKNKNVKMVFLDFQDLNLDRPESAILLQFMGMMAELESKMTSKRTKEVMTFMKDNGSLNMKLGYGYKYDEKRNIIRIEDEIKAIEEIKKIIEYFGNPSYSIIIKTLKRKNVAPLRDSKKWYATTIKRIIEDERHGIKLVGPKKEFDGRGQVITVKESTNFGGDINTREELILS